MAELLKVEADFTPFINQLQELAPAKWAGVLAQALNESGYYALNKYKATMPSYFDRPTPYTVNSMYLKKATSTDLNASVQWKTSSTGGSAGKYLQPEVFGGKRPTKGFERALQSAGLMPKGYVAVPTDEAPKDSFGNVPASFQQTILKYLKANPVRQASKQFTSLKAMGFSRLVVGVAKTAMNYERKAANESRAFARNQRYFTIQPDDKSRLPIGIYERTSSSAGAALPIGNQGAAGGGALGIRKLFSFVSSATYKVSYPFEQIGKDAVQSKFADKLSAAIAASVEKAKAK
jgi:hypothetical protein